MYIILCDITFFLQQKIFQLLIFWFWQLLIIEIKYIKWRLRIIADNSRMYREKNSQLVEKYVRVYL